MIKNIVHFSVHLLNPITVTKSYYFNVYTVLAVILLGFYRHSVQFIKHTASCNKFINARIVQPIKLKSINYTTQQYTGQTNKILNNNKKEKKKKRKIRTAGCGKPSGVRGWCTGVDFFVQRKLYIDPTTHLTPLFTQCEKHN